MSALVRLPIDRYAPDAFSAFAPGPFSLGAARAAAWLSQLAYEDQHDKVDVVSKRWGLKRVLSFRPLAASILPLARTRGHVFTGYGAHFVAFAGTDPLVVANWVTNLDFPLNEAGIHRGFGSALDAAWSQLVAALIETAPVRNLVVVGHSLGAALAVLAAERLLKERQIDVQAVYAYGMPRAGNAKFADAYDSILGARTFRLVHGEDIVPTVPPTQLGYAHVGRHNLCGRNARFALAALAAARSEDPRFRASLVDRLEAGLRELFDEREYAPGKAGLLGHVQKLLPPGIADHMPVRYLKALDP